MAKKTEETKHSPLPWRVGHANGCIEDSNGHMVADMGFYGLGKGEASGNAPFIVHCVNIHDKLVEALKKLVDISLRIGLEDSQPMRDEMAEAVVGAEAALADLSTD